MIKVNVKIVVAAIVGMGMWFMGGRCVNDVIPRNVTAAAITASPWLQGAFTRDKCANKIEAVYL